MRLTMLAPVQMLNRPAYGLHCRANETVSLTQL